MTTTPLMSLVLPTDHGSAETWDVILDTVFGLIDGHDHTTGKGTQVPSAGLKINANVSWSFGGTSHAITDLAAIDFIPTAVAGLTLLAGALFVSDGTGTLTANELYWRTTGGTNVKLTSGAALNVAAFTGGFGGDYAAAGALALFDDATDSYWFQQQVGASVRQYARMRSADVDLFEYKANPAPGVPTNRVRLSSPATLAASYALTFPAALPGSTLLLQLSAAGDITASNATAGQAISGTLSVSGVTTATGGVTTPSGITYTGSAEEHHPDRLCVIDCSDMISETLEHNGSQGLLQSLAFDGTNPITLRSFFVGAGNASGSISVTSGMSRLRVGDKITTIEVIMARTGNPDGLETFQIVQDAASLTNDTVAFTSGTLTRPSAGSIASTGAITVNYTVVSGSGLRFKLRSTNTATGGTMYIRHVLVAFQRP